MRGLPGELLRFFAVGAETLWEVATIFEGYLPTRKDRPSKHNRRKRR